MYKEINAIPGFPFIINNDMHPLIYEDPNTTKRKHGYITVAERIKAKKKNRKRA